MKDITLVYLVAGLSNRFGGNVKAFAKVGPSDESLIELSVNGALKSGFSKIVFVVSEATYNVFHDFFGSEYRGVPVEYAFQEFDASSRDKPWGTMDALCCARKNIDEDFVVCSGDDLYGSDAFSKIFRHLQEEEDSATVSYNLGGALSESGDVNRGIFKIEGDSILKIDEILGINRENLKEKGLSKNSKCSQNIFGLRNSILDIFVERFEKFKQANLGDRTKECHLPVELSKLIQEGKVKVQSYPTKGKWRGITNPGDELILREDLRLD